MTPTAALAVIDWGALAGIIGSLATVVGVLGGLDLRRRKRANSQRAASRVRDADDDDEALSLAQQNGDTKSAVVLAVLDRQMRKNVDCEVKLAQEKKERKADVKRLEARLEELEP